MFIKRLFGKSKKLTEQEKVLAKTQAEAADEVVAAKKVVVSAAALEEQRAELKKKANPLYEDLKKYICTSIKEMGRPWGATDLEYADVLRLQGLGEEFYSVPSEIVFTDISTLLRNKKIMDEFLNHLIGYDVAGYTLPGSGNIPAPATLTTVSEANDNIKGYLSIEISKPFDPSVLSSQLSTVEEVRQLSEDIQDAKKMAWLANRENVTDFLKKHMDDTNPSEIVEESKDLRKRILNLFEPIVTHLDLQKRLNQLSVPSVVPMMHDAFLETGKYVERKSGQVGNTLKRTFLGGKRKTRRGKRSKRKNTKKRR